MTKKIAAALSLVFFWITVAAAQFADQATYVGTSSGAANAPAIVVPNATKLSDLQGVLIKFLPNNANTGATSIGISGNAGSLSGSPIPMRKASGSGLVALTGGELQTNQPIVFMYDGTYADIVSSVNASPSVGAVNLLASAQAFSVPPNLQINTSVGSNQLTIAIVGNNGSNASSASPIPVAFRDATIADGDPVFESITGALSFTISSGNTMGCQNAVMCRLWLFLANNAGTVVLCAYNANSGGTSIIGVNEQNLQTSAGGTSGGSSAQTLYCNAAVSSVAVRYVGYVDVQETTAGTWSSGPNRVQLFGPGIRKPGDRIQIVYATSTTASAFGTSATMAKLTPTVSITPTSAANLVTVRCSGEFGSTTATAAQQASIQLSAGNSFSGFGSVGGGYVPGESNQGWPFSIFGIVAPNSTSTQSYAPWGASANSQAFALNEYATGTTGQTECHATEIQGKLEPILEPAADAPARMMG